MAFTQNHVLLLPELAARLGLTSPEFRVDRIIKGGMGECIRIVQQRTSFALKVIQDELVEDPEAWSRYLREVRLWTTLSACDGVVEAFCVRSSSTNFLSCARAGWTAATSRPHLRNRSPDSSSRSWPASSARFGGRTKARVIHRDLKPDNILLDEAGVAFVSDWGLARPLTVSNPKAGHRVAAVQRSTHPALTAVGSFLGTLYYASPEQLLGEAATRPADRYLQPRLSDV